MNPVVAFGNRGVLIKFDSPPSRELTARLVGLAVAAARQPGVIDAAPGLTSVLIELAGDDASSIYKALPGLLAAALPLEGAVHQIPVRYDGEDLPWVLDRLGMEASTFIGLHCEPLYDVRLLGSPGFIYLSEVCPQIAVPRLETPRRQVAAGSVGIGGAQAGIYGRARPGGWRIIARAPEVPRMRPGDRVRFVR